MSRWPLYMEVGLIYLLFCTVLTRLQAVGENGTSTARARKGAEAMLQIRNLRKSFGDLQVLKGIDLDVNKGDVVAILGPSGSRQNHAAALPELFGKGGRRHDDCLTASA